MRRITQSNVEGAFKRLHKAMGWPEGPHYTKGEDGHYHANVGAVALSQTGYGYNVEIIVNENGGVDTPFMGWQSKREAWDTMLAMAQAIELYKRQHA